MSADLRTIDLDDPITLHLRADHPSIPAIATVAEALAAIREGGVGEGIVYFYVVDGEGRLAGVIPTRKLLMAELGRRVGDIMITRVVAIPAHFRVLDACELFVMHRFLALPVVDEERRILGVVDIRLFTEEVFDLAERRHADAVFEGAGIRIAELRDARPVKAFRFRIPWLLATIASGTACALLVSVFELTLAQSLILAFFLTLVLGLGESVSMQSMSVAIQALATHRPTIAWFRRALWRELAIAILLGAACGAIVGAVALFWRRDPLPAAVIGGGIFLSMVAACLIGLSVPTLLHALRLDPKISAGPVTLALADICTLTFYFSLATWML